MRANEGLGGEGVDDCIFCAIAKGEAPARVVLEDDETMAIHDLHPQAPLHVLVIPRRHIGSLTDLGDDDRDILGRLMTQAVKVARKVGLDPAGYRLVVNAGRDGNQTVPHLHVHVLGGRPMAWPPG